MKKIIPLVLAAAMSVSIFATGAFAASGLSNFQKSQTYTDGQYTDFASTEWYNANVKLAYEYDLIKGKSATTFAPNANMRICEAIALAARMHSIYMTGSADFVQGAPWYQVYYDYAIAEGIIRSGEYSDMQAAATRQDMAMIFTSAMPREAYPQISSVPYGAIPDVTDENEAVYTLYRAGITKGKTAEGHFYPADNIKRSEVAAIVSRIAEKSLREVFVLTPPKVNEEEKEQLLDYSAKAYSALQNAFAYINANPPEAKKNIELAAFYAQEAANLSKKSATYSSLYENYDLAMLFLIKAEDEVTNNNDSSAKEYMNGAAALLIENDDILNGK